MGDCSISNLDSLLGHGMRGPREPALRVAAAGLAACDPELAVERFVRLDGDALAVDGRRHPLRAGARVVVLGSGKASLKIALGLERVLGDRLTGGTVVVRDGELAASPERIEVLEASHPLPDERSFMAARRLLEEAAALGPRDVLLACFTGGSSALTSLFPAGVSAAEKRELHRLLLASGMPISEVNTVRKHVSAFKGGRLALAAAPATVINLTVSDVAESTLDVLTDPSVPDSTTAGDATAILRRYGLGDQVPGSVLAHLEHSGGERLDLSGVEIHTTLLVTGETACEAMRAEAAALGVKAVVLSTSLEEDAAPLGRLLASLARESATRGRPFASPSVLVGCGGEATVRLGPGDDFGLGGPNGEAALAAATRLDGVPVALAFLDTDGSDGGTDLAGAVVDGATAARAREAGIDLAGALASHRSRDALLALGDGIITGPTHTNVNDLFVVAIGEPTA